MTNNLVAYSRAGDVFHYRWAARRCLKLVFPNSCLHSIVIEGSKENEKEGEYVIDVSEYYDLLNNEQHIKYYQLKHTTVQKDSPFTLSDLKDTFVGFASRYKQHLNDSDFPDISFILVTNRPVNGSFKNQILLLSAGKPVTNQFRKTIEDYTGLSSANLSQFCSFIVFNDGEGDYNTQKDELRFEISQILVGAVDNAQIENIVSLVQERVLPDSEGIITREDILKRFGISSVRDLFPAPAVWEEPEKIIEREQNAELIANVSLSSYPSIVHASGGVGKSVFCRHLTNSMAEGSLALVYDCFGAGRYRNRSEPRHRHRDALVQICNELAVKGLCDPFFISNTTLDSDIMKIFLWRIEAAVKNLKLINDSAVLFILIDAADNAEMAALEYSTPCFASDLIREAIPNGCKLVLTCRTERIYLLKPTSKTTLFELQPFAEKETLKNLREWFEQADEKDGAEFHRLTSGNPRVQANALSINVPTILEVLNKLGPLGMTVEEQIEQQLQNAVSVIKDSLPEFFQQHITAICLGLASLPPHIPLAILAKSAGVPVQTIKSFVADIGRSLWLSDESVQFRDEPTETWFRKTFLAEKEHYEKFIDILEPLSIYYAYVAEVLPHLYLQAEHYEKLIETSLSDKYLPQDNPIEARNVRVYRLQFAFRAALRLKKYKDAIKIAVRAGEEVAGNNRQMELFQSNIDLLVILQDKQKIQDIAFKRILKGNWSGSENAYTASLLSGIKDYRGEARGYLRAAENWMHIYYQENKKSDDMHKRNDVEQRDILEMAYAFLNIYGVKDCIDFLSRFSPKTFTFNIMSSLTERVIDIGDFEVVNYFLKSSIDKPYFTAAIVSELSKVGRFPEKQYLEVSLKLLMSSKTRIKLTQQHYSSEDIRTSIICLIEACLHRDLPALQLLKILKYYFPKRATVIVYSGHQAQERTLYLKALAVRIFLEGKLEVDIEALMPENLLEKREKKDHDRNNEIKEFKEVIFGLFPWYFIRVQILARQKLAVLEELEIANKKSAKARNSRHRTYDSLPNEIASIQSSILILYSEGTVDEKAVIFNNYIKSNKTLWFPDQLNTLRAAFRLSHLDFLKQELEQDVYHRISTIRDDGPQQAADRYISLARAVVNTASDDAGVYFEEAVKVVSKFGDEIVRRWEAVVSLAERSCSGGHQYDQLAYRFIRCAEVVGEYVDREKYWDRNEAVAICARMSNGVAIAALSRWRDRNIGSFEYQLEALLTELIQSGKVSSVIAWSMSRFFSHHQHESLLSNCLVKENDTEVKYAILADAVALLLAEGTSLEYWKKIKQVADEFNIHHETLEGVSARYLRNKDINLPENLEQTFLVADQTNTVIDWNAVFGSSDILTAEGYGKSLQLFYNLSENNFRRNTELFWSEALHRIKENEFSKFTNIVLGSDLDRYEVNFYLKALPIRIRNKVSFKKNWPNLVKQLGRKFAQELAAPYAIKYFALELGLKIDEIDTLKEGIFEGLAQGYEFSDAEMFFGFVNLAVPMVEPSDAQHLIDFTLSRFELHIEKDFGDGEWSELLSVPKDVNKQIAGFIWSALGSPRSGERWNAAHCIRMLAEFNCVEIIEELFKWMQHDKTDAFGCSAFPFYNLHARLYLLIALSRISLDKPEFLVPYKEVFVQYALGEPHVLIQRFAADSAINLSFLSEEIYELKTLEKIKSVGCSGMPIKKMAYGERSDSYWHANGEIASEYSFHFGWDFDRYWFEPLGDVFGISGKQAEDIAAEVMTKQWGIDKENSWSDDPRVDIWNRFSSDRETWHDHGTYPRTDNLDFYLSYHSMMVTAAKLLDKMPVVSTEIGEENEWDEWISEHILTCVGGKWLSDFRGAAPLERPKWIEENNSDNWREDISEEYFYKSLTIQQHNADIWLNVRGGWEEKDTDRSERVSINSALVSKDASNALLRALQSCSDPHDYKLPDYEEKRMEVNLSPFELKGWIKKDHASKSLDEYDPYAENVDYPPFIIGADMVNKLNLSTQTDGKLWYFPESTDADLECEIWSTQRTDKDENPDQSGSRLKASLPFLMELCSVYNCNLILEVEIKRDISYKYRSREDKYKNSKPLHKLFILSLDGELRTTTTNYKLR